MFKNEQEMQVELSKYARKFGGLSELIQEHELEKGNSLEEDIIINSYKYCLESLYETVLVSEDENISMFDKEQLKPDFLLFDPGLEKFVIVELKNAKSATRQAGTELGAYSNAIKNHFPMIADSDITFIVISSVWPTLLKNYIFNEIFWRKKKVLCLQPIVEEDNSIGLECFPPDQLFNKKIKTTFNRHSFSGMQYCIYGKGINSGEVIDSLDNHIERVKSAFERIIRKSQQNNSHGFAFLWKDLREGSLARYSVTFVDINPFEKYHEDVVEIESDFHERLYRCLSEHEVTGITGTTLDSMRNGDYFLDGIANPSPESSLPWEDLKGYMIEASELIAFKSWGVIADFYEEYLASLYKESIYDYKYDDPEIGLKFTESII